MNQFTVGLFLDCPTVTVHAGKKSRAMIDSGATNLLMHMSLCDVIEDHYKTSILPEAIHLKTVDGSPMSSLGKATPHLQIAELKFMHTFINCEGLPETDFLFGIDLQKRYSLSYCWDSDR